MLDLSILICTRNGAGRLGPTLEHLATQAAPGISWEVVVVDNGSDDGTPEFAASHWTRTDAPLRVLIDPRAGKSNALETGYAGTDSRYYAIVDDDNWVCPGWVAHVIEVLDADPGAAGANGPSEAIFEGEIPEFARAFLGYYAIGIQHRSEDTFDSDAGNLWGAGLVIRRSAQDALLRNGFTQRLSTVRGKVAAQGEDTELVQMLRLAGNRLIYDPALKIKHYMPVARFTEQSVTNMFCASARAVPYMLTIDLALEVARSPRPTASATLKVWSDHVKRTRRDILRHAWWRARERDATRRIVANIGLVAARTRLKALREIRNEWPQLVERHLAIAAAASEERT